MKIMSINIRGFGKDDESESKVSWFRKMRLTEKPDIVAVQESKCNKYIQKPKVGKSGGMFLIWDPNVFVVEEAVEKKYFLAIKGKWIGKDKSSIVVNVYGLHKDGEKRMFWDSLDNLMNYTDAEWVIGGDFNEVRTQTERQNCEFIKRRADLFNNFIENRHLIEVPILGKRFTRINDDGMKFSKLDQFLVSENFLESWGDISVITLDRRTSDHCPLILRDKNNDFGPKPFRMFDIWLECEEVEKIIVDSWNKQNTCSRPDCVYRNKLKNVKTALREWSKLRYGDMDVEIDTWKQKVEELECKADSGSLTETERADWINARIKWLQKDKEKGAMLKQKARLKWMAEGDDNTAFFHSTIKRKNNHNNIRGLHLQGIWEENPSEIKK
ncbi:uncharacterized protein [Rutidosis leptorrhynchoides]|uniref:uncharacterized protein n=1 Tax=Rutidosis leptorrhynchoides TaxID=125765 RepID=UPI003A99F304